GDGGVRRLDHAESSDDFLEHVGQLRWHGQHSWCSNSGGETGTTHQAHGDDGSIEADAQKGHAPDWHLDVLLLCFPIADGALDETDGGRVRKGAAKGVGDLFGASGVEAGGDVKLEFRDSHGVVLLKRSYKGESVKGTVVVLDVVSSTQPQPLPPDVSTD
nr:hypothetical protein [Tanacetum cinerariifolium]